MSDFSKNGGTGGQDSDNTDRLNQSSTSSSTAKPGIGSGAGAQDSWNTRPASQQAGAGSSTYQPSGTQSATGQSSAGQASGSQASSGQSSTGQASGSQFGAGGSQQSASPSSGASGSQASGNQASGSQASGSQSSASQAGFSDLQDRATKDYQQIRDTAKEQASHALGMSADMAAEKKNIIANQLAGVASALEKVGSEMKGDQAMVGRYAADLGGSAKRLAEDLKGRDMREIMSMAEDFGRKQPLAFLGLAALAGLAASRFVMSSSERGASASTSHSATHQNSGANRGSVASGSQSYGSQGNTQSTGRAGEAVSGQQARPASGFNYEPPQNRPVASSPTSLNRNSTEGRSNV